MWAGILHPDNVYIFSFNNLKIKNCQTFVYTIFFFDLCEWPALKFCKNITVKIQTSITGESSNMLLQKHVDIITSFNIKW